MEFIRNVGPNVDKMIIQVDVTENEWNALKRLSRHRSRLCESYEGKIAFEVAERIFQAGSKDEAVAK